MFSLGSRTCNVHREITQEFDKTLKDKGDGLYIKPCIEKSVRWEWRITANYKVDIEYNYYTY